VCAVVAAIIGFFLGLIADALWIPLALICTVAWLFYMLVVLIIFII